jgi:limonene-1,2-epoxide hydrolase
MEIAMSIITSINETNLGPLSRIVLEFCNLHDLIVPRAKAEGFTATGWAPMAELVATDEFKRVGAYLEVMNWSEYTAFLTQWASDTTFDSTLRRISEAGQAVFYEIEERHFRGEESIVKNVMAVFEFNERNKIRRLDIYEQAKNTGQWIIEAAQASIAKNSRP